MAKRLIGTATTDSNGVASVSYVGEGAGVLNIQAETDDGSLQSEIYEVLDCIFVGEGKTTGWLDGTSTTVTNVTLENGVVKWTVPSSSQYLGYRNNSASDLVGETIKTTVNLTSTKNVRLSAYAYVNSAWTNINSVLINTGTTTDTTLTVTIPEGTTGIWIRLQSNSSSDLLSQGDIVYVNKFEVYIA